jgi:hypothetical protein
MAGGTTACAVLRLAPVPHVSSAVAVLTAAAGLGMLVRSGLVGAPESGDAGPPARAAGVLAPVAGGMIGFAAVAAVLVALMLGAAAMAAAALVASNQAALAWTVDPGRLAVVASVLGGVALACAVAVLAIIRRR